MGSSSVVEAAQAQKVVATSNKLQLRAFAPSARATSYNRYIVCRRYLLPPPLCPGLHGVYVKQRVTTGPEIDSGKLKFIHINPNWHEGGYFYLVVLFESDFAS